MANLSSFITAANRLDYARSGLPVQIYALEAEPGVHLFDRSGKGIPLTESGSLQLQYANKILDLVDEFSILNRG